MSNRNRTREEARQALSEILDRTKSIFPGNSGGAATPGQQVGFTITLGGQEGTYQGKALSTISPGSITALRDQQGQWYVIDPKLFNQLQSELLQYRRGRRRRQAVEEGRVPYLVQQDFSLNGGAGLRTFHLIEGDLVTPLASIPRRIPECPPEPPDPSDPPLSGPYEGYFIYYFYAQQQNSPFLDPPDTAGLGNMPFGTTAYVGSAPFQWREGVLAGNENYTTAQAAPPLGLTVYNSLGVYGMGDEPSFTDFNDVVNDRVANQERLDFSFWKAWDIKDLQGNTVDTVALEVVVTMVYGEQQGDGSFTPPPAPPPDPSGDRRLIFSNFFGMGGPPLTLSDNTDFDANHPWERATRATPPPYDPPDPNDPNDPRNFNRENSFEISLAADRDFSYITLADLPGCPEGSPKTRLQIFRVPAGTQAVEITGSPPLNDWKGLKIASGGAAIIQIDLDPCISAELDEGFSNLLGELITRLLPTSAGQTLTYQSVGGLGTGRPSFAAQRFSFQQSANPTCDLSPGRRRTFRFSRIEIPNGQATSNMVIAAAPVIV